jgi:Tol biopolymer transport system component
VTPEKQRRSIRLFQEAADRPPGERSAFLAEACAGDGELRSQVESLLSSAGKMGDFLETPAIEAARATGSPALRPLPRGSRIAHYEVLGVLGTGGMGQVYRARDTRLSRDVAIKMLQAEFSSDALRLTRFETEARTISALNHPHIVTLYDVGTSDGASYIAMELVEGENLRESIERGALPIRKLLQIAVQVADGLAKAHASGIVHRDLKPDNVMVTPDGFAKILDFGLARLTARDRGASPGEAPTSPPATEPGIVMGTVGYMSPEQAMGKSADFRADQFSFGVMLYEMASGRRAFSRATGPETLSAIIREDPEPVGSVNPQVPTPLRWIVERCLAKDPEERYASTRDLYRDLQMVREHMSESGPAGVAAPTRAARSRLRFWQFTAAGLALLAVALAAVFVAPGHGVGPERSVRASILPPEKTAFQFGDQAGPPAISPDGRVLAFIARNLLWVRPVGELSAHPLEETDGASYPFWSPDSRLIAFFADGKLKKIDPAGGPPETLCNAGWGHGGTWGSDGTILFAPGKNDVIYRVSSSGGAAAPATRLDPAHHQEGHRWPFFLPDGQHFLYLVLAPASGNGLYLGSLDSGEQRLLIPASSNVAYAPLSTGASKGHLLFEREGNLMAQPFDARRLRINGGAVPIAEHVAYDALGPTAVFSSSQNGVLVFAANAGEPLSQLVWLDRAGKRVGTVGTTAAFFGAPRLSPDGRRAAITVFDPQTSTRDIWIQEVAQDVTTRLTFAPGGSNLPIWSPDGSRIAFVAGREGAGVLHQKLLAGGYDEELLFESHESTVPTDWSPDGRFIAFNVFKSPNAKWEQWILSVEDRKARPFIQAAANARGGRFSPDGRWLAYSSSEFVRAEVYVQPYPGPGGRWQISKAGGRHPRWRLDGKEIFYVSPDLKMMAVEVEAGSTFKTGPARLLFQMPATPTPAGPSYDVSHDGQRFLVNALVTDPTPTPLTLVLNWTAEVKKE